MKLEITLSILLHVVLVIATTIVMPMNSTKKFDFDDVIRVNLASFPEPAPQQVAPPAPAPIQPKVEEQAIPISKPKVPPKTVAKAKPKPKAPPKTKPVETEEAETEAEPTDVTEAGPGSPFQGVKVDNADFNYPYWFTQAFYKIQSNWRNTTLYDGTLVCVIYFQVIRSGSVVDVKIESSSGVEEFDAGCLAAIERSKPFPPLPREFVDEILGITIPFKLDPQN
jgi:periplasmic protein TonB